MPGCPLEAVQSVDWRQWHPLTQGRSRQSAYGHYAYAATPSFSRSPPGKNVKNTQTARLAAASADT